MEEKLEGLASGVRRLLALHVSEGLVDSSEVAGLSREVLRLADALYAFRGRTVEEEARCCLYLLMAYSTAVYAPSDRWSRVWALSRRAALAPSALKVRLLVWSYAGVEDERLLSEANEIIAGWDRQRLTEEQEMALREMETFFVLD